MSNSVTLIDVAEKTGVSMMTVSAALRGVGRMADKTRKQVLKEASLLGYQPNAAARSIRSGQFGCIAMLMPFSISIWGQLTYDLLDGIETVLEQKNLHLALNRLPDQQLTNAGYMPKMLREAMADGLLIRYDQNIPSGMVELINENRIPAIWMNSKQDADCIYPDEFSAGKIAAERLLKLGHKQIAYLCYAGRGHYNIIDRFEGYKNAMHEAGLPAVWLDEEHVQVPRTERGNLMQKWLSNPDRPTAIIVPEVTAKILLYTASKMGIDVPEDLSIVTFSSHIEDDLGLSLDTIVTPYRDLGLNATKMLLKKISNPGEKLAPQILSPKTIWGTSTAKLR